MTKFGAGRGFHRSFGGAAARAYRFRRAGKPQHCACWRRLLKPTAGKYSTPGRHSTRAVPGSPPAWPICRSRPVYRTFQWEHLEFQGTLQAGCAGLQAAFGGVAGSTRLGKFRDRRAGRLRRHVKAEALYVRAAAVALRAAAGRAYQRRGPHKPQNSGKCFTAWRRIRY